MKSVNIAKFKAELSKYLGFVRKGEEVVVMDRKESIARIVPYTPLNSAAIGVIEATEDCRKLFLIEAKPLKGQKLKSLQYLQEERGER